MNKITFKIKAWIIKKLAGKNMGVIINVEINEGGIVFESEKDVLVLNSILYRNTKPQYKIIRDNG